jgi:K+-transporting ATPase A subunit
LRFSSAGENNGSLEERLTPDRYFAFDSGVEALAVRWISTAKTLAFSPAASRERLDGAGQRRLVRQSVAFFVGSQWSVIILTPRRSMSSRHLPTDVCNMDTQIRLL